MSGFAGILRFDGDFTETHRLEAMLAQVRHRGPDGEATAHPPGCGLAHARLSIIDLFAGHQPMHLAALEQNEHPDASDVSVRGSVGPLHCVFNGEIYNHAELRHKLEKRGHRFRSNHSDTEVLLLGYRQWGTRLPKHLHGMFAFAVWDEAERKLMLVRDRLGKKPLYFAQSRVELIFGSLAATVAAGFPACRPPRLRNAALLDYLRLGFAESATLIDGVEALPPASVMTVNAAGRTETQTYWRPPPVSKSSTSMGAAVGLNEVLTEAVGKRLEADVPLAAVLSGGMDSALVAAIAQQLLQSRGGDRLRTLSTDIPAIGYHANDFARQAAKHIDSEHHALTAGPTQPAAAIDDLYRLLRLSGEPQADPAALPAYWMFQAASEHARTVISGVGGEEVFGGWPRYRMMGQIHRYRWWLARSPRLFPHAAPDTRRWRIKRRVEAAKAGLLHAQHYHQLVHVFTDRQIATLAPGVFPTLEEFGSHAAADWPPIPDPAQAAMRWDLHHVVPYRLLHRVDRSSMAVPIETRLPLLDTSVLDLAAHLPRRVLMPGGKPKGLLIEVARRHLPAPLAEARPPTFRLPIARWFRHALREPLREHLRDGRLTSLGLHQSEIDRYFHEHQRGSAAHTERLLALLSLSLYMRYIETLS